MKTIEINFYNAFEGNDGVIILADFDNYSKRIIVWDGFFKEIIDKIDPMIDDELNDLIRCYDEIMMSLENDNDLSQVFNLEIIFLQLQNIKSIPDTKANQIYYDAENRIISEMILLFSEAIDRKTNVYMQKC